MGVETPPTLELEDDLGAPRLEPPFRGVLVACKVHHDGGGLPARLRAVVALEHSRHRGVVGHCLRERTARVTRRPCDGRVQGAQRDLGSGMDGLQLQQQRAGQRRGGGKGRRLEAAAAASRAAAAASTRSRVQAGMAAAA